MGILTEDNNTVKIVTWNKNEYKNKMVYLCTGKSSDNNVLNVFKNEVSNKV